MLLNNKLDKKIIINLEKALSDFSKSNLFIQYLLNKEKGLRKKAFDSLNNFIKEVCRYSEQDRKSLSYLICEQCLIYEKKGYHFIKTDLISFNFGSKIILPTLKDNLDLNDYRPYFWIARYFIDDGNYSQFFDYDVDSKEKYLQQALDIESLNQDVIIELVELYISNLQYSSHHLSESKYLGNESYDEKLMDKINKYIELIFDEKVAKKYFLELDYYKQQLKDWNNFKASNEKNFSDYCRKNDKRYKWSAITYYRKNKL